MKKVFVIVAVVVMVAIGGYLAGVYPIGHAVADDGGGE